MPYPLLVVYSWYIYTTYTNNKIHNMEDKEAQFIRLAGAITPRQKAFADAYMICLNAAQAAREIGICQKSASSSAGKFLRIGAVREYINFHLTEAGLTDLETIKSISDISRASVNDYFKIETKATVRAFKQTYPERIQALKNEIDDLKQEPGLRKDLGAEMTEGELEINTLSIRSRIAEVADLTLKHRRNPAGFVWANEMVETEIAELDLVKLVRDKGAGKIKSFFMKENGEQRVEMYNSLEALQMMGKIQGIFEKDNRQQAGGNTLTVTIEQSPELDEFTDF